MGVLSGKPGAPRARRLRPLRTYNALLLAAGFAVAPAAGALALVRPSWRRGLGERFGRGWHRPDGSPVLWAHAASVGEVEGIAPLVRRWSAEYPSGGVIVSALSATGCDAARRLLPGAIVRTFPLDAPWLARAVVRRISPDLFLFSENELWPNTLDELARMGCPTVQVSGRMSERSARLLARFPGFAPRVLDCVTRFCVQSDDHRRRLQALGVDDARIVVTGSLKGDRIPAEPAWFVPGLREAGRPVLVAGSTREGEEAAVLDALARLGSDAPFLVLAPRHPERFAQVASLLERSGLRFERRSSLVEGGSSRFAAVDVLLLDSLGELAGCYAGADIAFVGGTLVPVGGHNLLEPARCGVPVLLGPHRDTVRAFADRLVEGHAGAVVEDAEGLAAALRTLLDPAVRARAGASARALALEESGGLEATWRVIADLDGRPGAARVAPA